MLREVLAGSVATSVMLARNGIYKYAMPPEEVAKTILKAVTAEEPEPRYLVGNDAAMVWRQGKTCLILNLQSS